MESRRARNIPILPNAAIIFYWVRLSRPFVAQHQNWYFWCRLPPLAESTYSDFRLPYKITTSQIILLMSRIAPATDATCQLVLDMGYFNLLDFIDETEFSYGEIACIYLAVLVICTRWVFPWSPLHSYELDSWKDAKIHNWKQGNGDASF